MRLYQIGEDHAYIEIDINSPEGILIMNTCFDNSDIKGGGFVVNRRSKDDMEVKFVLILNEEKYTIDEVLERCDDDQTSIDKLKELQSYVVDSLDEFINWFVKACPGYKCTITIDDGCTSIDITDITDKTEEDTNEVK